MEKRKKTHYNNFDRSVCFHARPMHYMLQPANSNTLQFANGLLNSWISAELNTVAYTPACRRTATRDVDYNSFMLKYE